jgi:hypothetical protein
MSHYKRSGPKSTRAGCLLCKPHKRQGAGGKDSRTRQGERAREGEREQRAAVDAEPDWFEEYELEPDYRHDIEMWEEGEDILFATGDMGATLLDARVVV